MKKQTVIRSCGIAMIQGPIWALLGYMVHLTSWRVVLRSMGISLAVTFWFAAGLFLLHEANELRIEQRAAERREELK